MPKYEQTTYATGFALIEHEGIVYEIPGDVDMDSDEYKSLPADVRKAFYTTHRATDALRKSMTLIADSLNSATN